MDDELDKLEAELDEEDLLGRCEYAFDVTSFVKLLAGGQKHVCLCLEDEDVKLSDAQMQTVCAALLKFPNVVAISMANVPASPKCESAVQLEFKLTRLTITWGSIFTTFRDF